MAKYVQNKTVTYERRRYEIVWLTPYIVHINKNLEQSHLPHLDFEELEKYAQQAVFISFHDKYYIGLFRKQGTLHQIIAYFERVKKHYRCIIKTGYQTTDTAIRELAQQLGI